MISRAWCGAKTSFLKKMLGLRSRQCNDSSQDQVYSSQLPSSIATDYHRSQKRHSKEPVAVSLEAIERVLRGIGQELSCPICLGVLEDAVSLPCTHFFCESCFERSITIKPTRRDSLSTSGQCPLCKAHISKRSSSPADAIRILADAYKKTITAYEADTGKQWESVELELSKQKACSGPIENLSQLYPYPEKKRKKGVTVVVQKSKSPSPEHSVEDLTNGMDSQATVASGIIEAFPSKHKIVVCTSLLSRSQQATLLEWVSTFDIEVSCSLISTVNYLIVRTNSQRVTKRTLKYCQAVLAGRWIISFECTHMHYTCLRD